jgi:hypothetical protein
MKNARLLAAALLVGCDGCEPTDDGRVVVEPIDTPLGAMYFCPYWAMHRLSHNCNQRRDAPCAYAELGLPVIKLEDLRWDHVEKRAPVAGVHDYDWSVLDEAVLRWEEAGAQHLQFHLTPDSSWGGQDSRAIAEEVFGLDCSGGDCDGLPTNPAPEHRDDWRAFVTALCERYDGDGVEDMEGLRYAHLAFELLNEGQNWVFYMGSSEDYAELLEDTRQALDACNPAAEIIHYGVTFNGLMHGEVADEVYWERMEQKASSFDPKIVGPGYRHAHRMMLGDPDPGATVDALGTLSMCDRFEAVDLHCNMGIQHMIEEHAFLRAKLDGWGCQDVEILCGDSTSGPALYSPWELEWWDSSYGGADSTGERVHLALSEPYASHGLLCNPDGLDTELSFEAASAWYHHQHAAFLVKKASTALALGMGGYLAGLLENWPPASGCYWMYQGLTASEVQGLGLLPVDYGEPLPVYRSYRLLAEKLQGMTAASRELVDGVTLLRFERPQGPLYLVWYLDDELPAPGEAEQSAPFVLEVEAGSVRITSLITEEGQPSAGTETVSTSDGVYAGLATQTPVFIEPVLD